LDLSGTKETLSVCLLESAPPPLEMIVPMRICAAVQQSTTAVASTPASTDVLCQSAALLARPTPSWVASLAPPVMISALVHRSTVETGSI